MYRYELAYKQALVLLAGNFLQITHDTQNLSLLTVCLSLIQCY